LRPCRLVRQAKPENVTYAAECGCFSPLTETKQEGMASA
jgi:hypothetical protein